MGKLKEEVLHLFNGFIADHLKKEKDLLIEDLSSFSSHLSQIIKKHDSSYVSIHTDGSSKGNPGEARIGMVFKDRAGTILFSESRPIGIKTNNEAEYTGIIEALKTALNKNYKKVLLYSDSQVVVNQINNSYKIKTESLRPYYNEVRELIAKFEDIRVIHVRREHNREADLLSN